MRKLWIDAPYTPRADRGGTIQMFSEHGAFRVVGSFTGGGEAWATTLRAALRVTDSMRRWWTRHQDGYLAQLACCQDPGDRMPCGWTPPRRRG